MAATAQQDQKKRSVTVDRLKLAEILKKNCQKHIAEYQEALVGYKATLLQKIDEGFAKAKESLIKRQELAKAKVDGLTDEEILKQNDWIQLSDAITVEMRVPHSYAKEYDSAIDMAEWDVRETLDAISATYKNIR